MDCGALLIHYLVEALECLILTLLAMIVDTLLHTMPLLVRRRGRSQVYIRHFQIHDRFHSYGGMGGQQYQQHQQHPQGGYPGQQTHLNYQGQHNRFPSSVSTS